jgi:hypothetical protein
MALISRRRADDHFAAEWVLRLGIDGDEAVIFPLVSDIE